MKRFVLISAGGFAVPVKAAVAIPEAQAPKQSARSAGFFNRFHCVFEELAAVGVHAEPAVYDEEFADEVRAQLLQAAGVLVWVNPLQDGKNARGA